MAKFYLPVTWEVCGIVEIEAETLEDAVKYFDENTTQIDTPSEEYYVDGSFRLSSDDIEDLRFMEEDEHKRREGNNE